MTGYLLVIWTAVALSNGYYTKATDWRPVGVFATEADCNEAARTMGQKPNEWRCLKGATK